MRVVVLLSAIVIVCSPCCVNALTAGTSSVIKPMQSASGQQQTSSSSPFVSAPSSLLNPWREYDCLRGSALAPEVLEPFFAARGPLIAQRLWLVSSTLWGARRDWQVTMGQDTEDRADRLCKSLASLGPVSVKVGQTLAQRPDIIGLEAAEALARLQTKNIPYDNALAYAVIQESLQCTYIAPGIGEPTGTTGTQTPLFKTMTKDPVACASLGQVYKATTWEGLEVAVKVQRPDAMKILSLDLQCFRQVFGARNQLNKLKTKLFFGDKGGGNAEQGDKQNVATVIDRVGRDILDELNYHIEAANSVEFRESLAFLGFLTTPEVVHKYSGERVLVTEWIPGQHVSALNLTAGMAMTRMAVEACTASMVLTGLVHADPHEGNLMLHDDGRLVFLDFGLMSRVDQSIMEGFAQGIQAVLSEDWVSLTDSFVDVGFVTEPIMHRNGENETWAVDPNYGREQLAQDLAAAMETTEGGQSRFGALATVLNKRISPTWLIFTPPYVLLLIRTFLTLEGIAARLDPEFNIYEMAMPWAVRRSLSPSTARGIEVMRSTLMTPDNRIQWARLLELASAGNDDNVASTSTANDDKTKKKVEQDTAKKVAMNDAVGTLLGSTEGKVLRRALRDLDTVDLLTKLSSKDGRPLLQQAAAAAFGSSPKTKRGGAALSSTEESLEEHRPVSDDCEKLRQRQARWKKKVGRLLIYGHVRRQFGWKGLASFAKVSLICSKLFAVAMWKALRRQFSGNPTSSVE